MQGTEAHDQLLGQVFGFAAVIRSGQQIDDETAVKCADGLVYIANKKSFLRELATNVLVELTGRLLAADMLAFNSGFKHLYAVTAFSGVLAA